MSLVLNEEQIQLQDAARKFVQERLPVAALRSLRDNKISTGIDADTWKEMAELGWAGILIDEAFGGLGLGALWMGLISEECGRGLAATPLLSSAILSSSLIQQLGNPQQKANLLGNIASGELLCALALDEGAHHNPANIQCEAKADGDGFVINGEKVFVIDGHIAQKLLVVARTGGKRDDRNGLSVFVVDANAAGVEITRNYMVDFHNAARVKLRQVKVESTSLLGEAGSAFDAIAKTLDIANACLAAETLGATQEAFGRIVDYLKTRTQFDVLIGSFQALQHRAADMFSEIELSKACVRKALVALENNDAEASRYVSMAKALVSDTAQLVSNEGIQMFGGIGMTDEEDIGFFLKRIRVLIQTFGNASYHKKRYADLSGF